MVIPQPCFILGRELIYTALTRQVVRAAAASLLGAGVEFLEAGDGAVGYRLATGHALDLVVCDLNMPEMDGYALLARLRGLARHKATPVIILSSLVNKSDGGPLEEF